MAPDSVRRVSYGKWDRPPSLSTARVRICEVYCGRSSIFVSRLERASISRSIARITAARVRSRASVGEAQFSLRWQANPVQATAPLRSRLGLNALSEPRPSGSGCHAHTAKCACFQLSPGSYGTSPCSAPAQSLRTLPAPPFAAIAWPRPCLSEKCRAGFR